MLNAKEDPDTLEALRYLDDRTKIRENLVPGVRTVLVILSSDGMVFDTESLRQKIIMAYPDAAIFFRSTSGSALGVPSPQTVDLLIDFTGPGQVGNLLKWGGQGFFYALRLRRMVKFAVGRNAGMFRKKAYDRIFDEKDSKLKLPDEILAYERFVQTQVLALAGVAFIPMGELTADRARDIALDLPPMVD